MWKYHKVKILVVQLNFEEGTTHDQILNKKNGFCEADWICYLLEICLTKHTERRKLFNSCYFLHPGVMWEPEENNGRMLMFFDAQSFWTPDVCKYYNKSWEIQMLENLRLNI